MHAVESAADLPPDDNGQPWYRLLTRYHWFVLAVAALGWLFDTFDQQLFNLGRKPAMTELLGATSASDPRVDEYGAYATSIFIMGWAMGLLITALILRYGQGAENLAWTVVFLLAPISAVYYPVTVLPGWLQHVAWALPSTYVFEGMRVVLIEHVLRTDLLMAASALNLVCLAIGVGVYMVAFRRARQRGLLLQVGE